MLTSTTGISAVIVFMFIISYESKHITLTKHNFYKNHSCICVYVSEWKIKSFKEFLRIIYHRLKILTQIQYIDDVYC